MQNDAHGGRILFQLLILLNNFRIVVPGGKGGGVCVCEVIRIFNEYFKNKNYWIVVKKLEQ